MSAQDELDQRIAELKELLGWVEALFPSLFVHGLHITAQDMTLFNKQYNLMSSMIDDLPEADQAIGLKILHWFHHNYPHREQRRPPQPSKYVGHPSPYRPPRVVHPVYRPSRSRHLPPSHNPNIFETLIRQARERAQQERARNAILAIFEKHFL